MKWLIMVAALLALHACEQPASNIVKNQPEPENMLSPQEAEEESLYQSLIAVHDEVMPLTPTLNRVARQLNAIADTAQNKSMLKESIRDIRRANENMMDWMYVHNQDQPTRLRELGFSHAQIMDTLRVIESEIRLVSKDMKQSLESGRQLLQMYQ